MESNRETTGLLLAQHRRLRPLLIALEKEASEVLATPGEGGATALQILRETVRSMQQDLTAHYGFEESVLESVLAGAGGPGRARLGHLRSSHRHHRKLLDAVCADPPVLAPQSLARVAAGLAGEVLAGMVDEERDFEAAGLFDDSVSAPRELEEAASG